MAEILAASPDVFPQAFDPVGDSVRFLWLSRDAFQRASFLDDRILAPGMRHETIHFGPVHAAVAATGVAESLGYIFHLGHVGSTLVSRLLGGHASVLSLREPAAFRVLAQVHAELQTPETLLSASDFDIRLGDLLRLWSRTYEPGQLAVVKATSVCAEMAASLLARPSRPAALFVTAVPEVHLATLLGGQNTHLEVRGYAPMRLRRLHRRLGRSPWRLPEMSPGEMVAMGWACEMTALVAAEEAAPGQGQWLDFDRFLSWPEPPLLAAFAHFGRTVSDDEVRAILAGPDMGRYAKATEHPFDAATRRASLQESRQLFADEIRKGLAWLDRAAADTPEIAAAIAAATRAAEGG
jgi:hypothetical protein